MAFALIGLSVVALNGQYQKAAGKRSDSTQAKLHYSVPIGTAFRNTPLPKERPSREEYREEKDLEAQWVMAVFTAGIGFLTFVGVVLLARTLKATRDAVDETGVATKAAIYTADVTREIGEAQTRAYLSVRCLHIGFNKRGDPALYVEFVNFGQSPALKAAYTVTAFYHRHKGKTKLRYDNDPSPLGHIGAGQTRTNQLVFPSLRAPKNFRKRLFSKKFTKKSVGIAIATSFYDVFGNHFFLKSGFIIRAYKFKPNGTLSEMETFGDEDAEVCADCQAEHDFQSYFPTGSHQ